MRQKYPFGHPSVKLTTATPQCNSCGNCFGGNERVANEKQICIFCKSSYLYLQFLQKIIDKEAMN